MKLTFINLTIDKSNSERTALIKQRPCSRNRHLWFFQVINEILDLDMPFSTLHISSKPIAPIFKKLFYSKKGNAAEFTNQLKTLRLISKL